MIENMLKGAMSRRNLLRGAGAAAALTLFPREAFSGDISPENAAVYELWNSITTDERYTDLYSGFPSAVKEHFRRSLMAWVRANAVKKEFPNLLVAMADRKENGEQFWVDWMKKSITFTDEQLKQDAYVKIREAYFHMIDSLAEEARKKLQDFVSPGKGVS